MVGYGENGSVIGPQNLPTGSVASGVWSLGEVAEAKRDSSWPNPTLGHWTFLGDPTKASGQPMSIYAEGGLYQTAAQAAAGNNEWLVLGRVTDVSGVTGSAVAIINGLRINGDAPSSGTISFNKGSWWSLSDGINTSETASIIEEDASGNLYIQYAGYVGTSYNPPRFFSRIIKLNSSLAEQAAISYKNTANVNSGLQKGGLTFMNSDLISMANAYEPQAFGTIKIVKAVNKHSTSTLSEGGQGYHIEGAGNSNTGQLFPNHILTNTGAISGQTANGAITNYDPNLHSGTNYSQIQLVQLTWDGSSLSYNTTMDFALYSASTGGRDYNLADMETEGNTTYTAGYGQATSVVSGTKYYSAICKHTWGDSAGSVDFFVMKAQTGGKNENLIVSGLCLDYANNALYAHGTAPNIGAANTALSSVWIAKINLDSTSKKPSSLAWINSYCNESFGANLKAGRHSLVLTANNTITSFGWTQNQASASYAPAVVSLITVPIDGSAKGGSGTVGNCSVTSHDISSFVLFQGSGSSTNVTLSADNSGTTNMAIRNGNVLASANAQGTSNYPTLTPNPTEYISGGI